MPNEDSSVQSDQSSLPWWRNFSPLAIQNAVSEDSDQTARTNRPIWNFTRRICPKVRFLTSRLINIQGQCGLHCWRPVARWLIFYSVFLRIIRIIANTRSVCITVARLTTHLGHLNFVWRLVANFVLSRSPSWIRHHGKHITWPQLTQAREANFDCKQTAVKSYTY